MSNWQITWALEISDCKMGVGQEYQDAIHDCVVEADAEISALQSTNAELLEALEDAYDMLTYAEEITGIKAYKFVKARQQAYRAIRKAKEK